VERAHRTLHLLAIGVNEYQHISKLKWAVGDGERVATIFTGRAKGLYDEVAVTRVCDDQASRANILNALQDVVEAARMNDLVVLFYSGHGWRTEDDKFYFVCPDADAESIREKGISSDDIKGFCKALGAKSAKALLLIDACHSGAMKLDDLALELGRDEYKVAMMASSRGHQVSWEHEGFGGGAFTQALHLGLFEGQAETVTVKDGIIDTKELGNYVEQAVDANLISTIQAYLRERYPESENPHLYTNGVIQQTPVSNFTSQDRIQLTRVGDGP
jgi:uncharacterized caspase-like protein